MKKPLEKKTEHRDDECRHVKRPALIFTSKLSEEPGDHECEREREKQAAEEEENAAEIDVDAKSISGASFRCNHVPLSGSEKLL